MHLISLRLLGVFNSKLCTVMRSCSQKQQSKNEIGVRRVTTQSLLRLTTTLTTKQWLVSSPKKLATKLSTSTTNQSNKKTFSTSFKSWGKEMENASWCFSWTTSASINARMFEKKWRDLTLNRSTMLSIVLNSIQLRWPSQKSKPPTRRRSWTDSSTANPFPWTQWLGQPSQSWRRRMRSTTLSTVTNYWGKLLYFEIKLLQISVNSNSLVTLLELLGASFGLGVASQRHGNVFEATFLPLNIFHLSVSFVLLQNIFLQLPLDIKDLKALPLPRALNRLGTLFEEVERLALALCNNEKLDLECWTYNWRKAWSWARPTICQRLWSHPSGLVTCQICSVARWRNPPFSWRGWGGLCWGRWSSTHGQDTCLWEGG